ncbi:MAG: hypothetical protein RR444_09440, partial [Oscillospiraceae bacterium]
MNRTGVINIKRSFKGIIYDTIYGIQNIFIWFPTIWKDRNWDYGYIYRLFYKKLCLMEKSHKKFSPVVEEERDKIISEIVTAKNICKRIIDDEYLMTALYPVEQKYGEGHFDFIDCENGDQTMVDNRTDEHKSAWA